MKKKYRYVPGGIRSIPMTYRAVREAGRGYVHAAYRAIRFAMTGNTGVYTNKSGKRNTDPRENEK